MAKFYWTPDRIRRADALWEAGVSGTQIAQTLGCNEKSFRNYVHRTNKHRYNKETVRRAMLNSSAGLTAEAASYMEGMTNALRHIGHGGKADEVDRDIMEAQELAKKFGITLDRQRNL